MSAPFRPDVLEVVVTFCDDVMSGAPDPLGDIGDSVAICGVCGGVEGHERVMDGVICPVVTLNRMLREQWELRRPR